MVPAKTESVVSYLKNPFNTANQNGLIVFIFQVLAFFSARLEQHPDQTLSVGVVLDVIKQGTLQWPRDRLKVTSLCSVKTKHFKVVLSEIKHLATAGISIPLIIALQTVHSLLLVRSYLQRNRSEDFILFVHAYARVYLRKSTKKYI